MSYVDGFILAVPVAKLDEYRKIAENAGAVWMEHGALSYAECVADDVPYGELTSFPRAVQQSDGETTVFAWIEYESREHRDAVNAKVMADPRIDMDAAAMPFDSKRMIYGGFKTMMKF